MKLKNILTYTAFLALGMLPAGCSQDGPLPPDDLEPGKLNLVLKMAVNPGGLSSSANLRQIVQPTATRADDYTFEKPANIYEGVRSLRIIIVRQDVKDYSNPQNPATDIVEYNEFYTFPDDQTIWDSIKQYEYLVNAGEKKRIYLIANEASLPTDFVDVLVTLKADDVIDESVLDNEMLISVDGVPYIDNSSSEGRRFIPMSEVFDADIPTQGLNQNMKYEMENALFLTRALSKFSFAIDVENSQFNYGVYGMKITSLTISGRNNTGCFAKEAWLFPHGMANPEDPESTTQVAGGAVYSPDKYGPSPGALNGKAITSFSTPLDAEMYSYTFMPEAFGIPGKTVHTDLSPLFAPLQYFLESPCKEFQVTLTTESNGEVRTYSAPVPNLPYFARNIHALMQFSFTGLNMEVVLVPYLGVSLNPWFGFE